MRVFYLRDRNNRTIVDCQVNQFLAKPGDKNQDGYVELHSTVDIVSYTDLLVENIQHADILKAIFCGLQELRGWLWENYLPNKNRAERYSDVLREVREMFNQCVQRINDLCGAGVFVVED